MAKASGSTRGGGARGNAQANGGGIPGFTKSASEVLERYGFKSASDSEFREIVESTRVNPDNGFNVTNSDAALRLPNGNILVANGTYNSLLEFKRNVKRDGSLSRYTLKSTAGEDGYKHTAKELESNLKYYKVKPTR